VAQDLIQYLSISHKYLSGDFGTAINGVWGPLLSWLLIPMLWMKVPDIFCFKILQILIGSVFLFWSINFVETKLHLDQDKIWNNLVLYPAIIIILFYYIFLTGTSDLLLSTLILIYLYIIIGKQYTEGRKLGIICGAIGALSYFAKSFALPFFLIHFLLIHIFYYNKYSDRRKIILSNFIGGLMVFVIFCSIWILLLSNKYGYITYSTAGNYNFNITGPAYKGIHTLRIEKLYPPVNSTATSYWEDPTYLLVKKWYVFSSPGQFFYLLKNIINNIRIFSFFFFSFSLFLVPLIILMMNNLRTGETVKLLAFSMALYIAGYLIFFIEERFFILPQILLVIITFCLLKRLFNNYPRLKKYKLLFYLLFFISVSIKPGFSLVKNINSDMDNYYLAEKLKTLKIQGNFAGMSKTPLAKDWGNTLFIAYQLNSKFYGEISPTLNQDSLYSELKKYHINYLFVWSSQITILQPNMHKVTENYITFEKDKKILTVNNFTKRIYSIFNLKGTSSDDKYLKIYKLD